MNQAVLDASVVLKWFQPETERHAAAARSLRADFQAGTLAVIAPPLLYVEIVNVAGRRWRWERAALVDLAHALQALRFDVRQPALGSVAEWTARGLTAYDATYVALAQAEAIPLVTDDEQILALAPAASRALAGV
ncbi:PIN domain-containing protein [bacterium]|nr:MAG: PIN domain-containing protein [bacterium]